MDIKLIQSQFISTELIVPNIGQIPDVPKNPRFIRDEKFEALKKSIIDNPEMLGLRELMVYPFEGTYVSIGGNQRLAASTDLGIPEIPCKVLPVDTPAKTLRAYILKDNYAYGENEKNILYDSYLDDLKELDMTDMLGFDIEETEDEKDVPDLNLTEKKSKGSLKNRFFISPFSIFDTRKAEWQNRKKAWIEIGLKSEVGRDSGLTFGKDHQPPIYYDIKNAMRDKLGYNPSHEEVMNEADRRGIKMMTCTSIFDPVLCEIMYRWFCLDGGKIIDPFCGGSVRGIVAGACGYEYHGNDLREEQVNANRDNLVEMKSIVKKDPTWYCGDSVNIKDIIPGDDFDLVFSCPPYADLEVYSDKPEDLSNMDYEDFISAYRKIINNTCSKLKDNRFAIFVVGEIRDKSIGKYRNFIADTINAFVDSGLYYYNKIILINSISSAAITAGSLFDKSRKVSKIHQDVLVFFKGNPKNIKTIYPELRIQEDMDSVVNVEEELL